jgi:hypothetical protein
MRVLIVEQRYDPGHYLNYVRYLVQAFVPLGYEIVVAVPNSAPKSLQFKIRRCVKPKRTRHPPPRSDWWNSTARRILCSNGGKS